MIQRLLTTIAGLVALDVALLIPLSRQHLPAPGLILTGVATPVLVLIPLVYVLPRRCIVCGRRTYRPLPFFQRLKEFLRIGGAAPRCSLHVARNN